jgi:hypothetical protein
LKLSDQVPTITVYLMELEKDYLDKVGETGKGTYYKLEGQ